MGFGVRIARLNAKHKENPDLSSPNCAAPLGISVKSAISHFIAAKIDFQDQKHV
jgi:hypothetical protein